MSPVGWEPRALDSIARALGGSDPKLASLLATFSRLASSEEMPPHEKVWSPLRHPPHRRRPRPRRGMAIRASLAGYLTELQGAPACGPVSGAVAVSVSSWLETCLTLTWRQGA